jgi:hypothetical protein
MERNLPDIKHEVLDETNLKRVESAIKQCQQLLDSEKDFRPAEFYDPLLELAKTVSEECRTAETETKLSIVNLVVTFLALNQNQLPEKVVEELTNSLK